MIRIFDFLFALFGLLFLLPVFLLLTVLGFADTGKPFFVQIRVGYKLNNFKLIKFRTMRPDTGDLPTHLVGRDAVTSLGRFLRKSKLDELPQLINVLKGEMSFVGPRPNLPSQEELIEERNKRDIYEMKPGITGLAQINGIDMSNPVKLAITDAIMMESFGVRQYFKYILATATGKGMGDNVR